jgi:hypothetical protein
LQTSSTILRSQERRRCSVWLADLGVYKPAPFDLSEPRATRRANLIIECGKADIARLHDAVPAAAGLDATIMAASYFPAQNSSFSN